MVIELLPTTSRQIVYPIFILETDSDYRLVRINVVERMFTKLKSTVAVKYCDVVAYSSRLIGLRSRNAVSI